MKVSKYTFLLETESKQFYIYNTLANSLIELDKEQYDILIDKQRHKPIVTHVYVIRDGVEYH